jgi:hypothetical protein
MSRHRAACLARRGQRAYAATIIEGAVSETTLDSGSLGAMGAVIGRLSV